MYKNAHIWVKFSMFISLMLYDSEAIRIRDLYSSKCHINVMKEAQQKTITKLQIVQFDNFFLVFISKK